MTYKQKIGQIGEEAACAFLKKHNFTIVERNYWKKWGEIDVVAQRGDDLRFVEVKTVSRATFKKDDYEPEDNLHPWKRKRLRRVIETYLLEKDLGDDIDWQVDAISVYLNEKGETVHVEHLEDIVL